MTVSTAVLLIISPTCILLAVTTPPTIAEERPYPLLVTAETRANPTSLAQLQTPGQVVFRDDFESADSLKHYFEVRGQKEGTARLIRDARTAHTGTGCIQFTSVARGGDSSGAGASYWFGPKGYEQIYLRRYIRFAPDYDQGNLNHVGGGLSGVAGTGKWEGMGKAGIRPNGDDRFSSRFEPWCDWKRYPPPGFMFLYTYWMDMKRDRDGHYWGNNMNPADNERITLDRDRWYCLEQMIKVNHPGQANGELAAWIDGELYIHYKGFRWRSTHSVRLKRFDIGVYVHQATRDNTVWYDDVVLSTGYIGPVKDTGRQR